MKQVVLFPALKTEEIGKSARAGIFNSGVVLVGNQVGDGEGILGDGVEPLSLSELDIARGTPLKLIAARGTEDGLTLRIDGRASWSDILRELEVFLSERKRFLGGSEVSIEWLDRLPTKEQSDELEELLRSEYDISIITRRRRRGGSSPSGGKWMEKRDSRGVTIPLFELNDVLGSSGGGGEGEFHSGSRGLAHGGRGESRFGREGLRVEPVRLGSGEVSSRDELREPSKGVGRMSAVLGEELFYEDANAKVVFGTLRSGQRAETPFSLVVIGDVNPGADLIAGGDILVFGSLRGTAHASAYDDEGTDRIIVALQMQPMQLRIGSVISRGSDEVVRGAEIARIEERRIVVERFNPRFFDMKRRREIF